MTTHNITISRNAYGGVSWSITEKITYDDIVYLVAETKDDRYFIIGKKDRECIKDLPKYKREITSLLTMIQVPLEDTIEIMTESPRARFVIYHLCKILGLRYERIVEHGRKYIGCNEYRPRREWTRRGKEWIPPSHCGCDYAPFDFWKYHVTNNYEDSVSYSNLPWTYKKGVRIFKKLI